jgi:GNAT superfamily N-acetyltransferase
MLLRLADQNDKMQLAARGVSVVGQNQLVIDEKDNPLLETVCYSELPFETKYLGLRSVKINSPQTLGKKSSLEKLTHGCVEYLTKNGYEFASCRVSENNFEHIVAFQNAGFKILECLLTLRYFNSTAIVTQGKDMPDGIGYATADDAEECSSIARRIFTLDRYHADPCIVDKNANDLKAAWARNSCSGYADVVFVAYEDGQIVGFNACLLKDSVAMIDLMGVLPEYCGYGIGRKLMQAAIAYYSGRVTYIQVGTQSRNWASLSLYQSIGFKVCHSAFTFHNHLNKK